MKFLFKRDRSRLISVIKGKLSTYGFLGKLHWGVRHRMAEDIFSSGVETLLSKYSHVVEMNYQRTEKLLYAILLNETHLFVYKEARRLAERYGDLDNFIFRLNKIQRLRNKSKDRKEYLRKQAKKRYYLMREDPEKWEAYLKYHREHLREYRRRKKQKIFEDRRLFDENNPFKLMKFTRSVYKKN